MNVHMWEHAAVRENVARLARARLRVDRARQSGRSRAATKVLDGSPTRAVLVEEVAAAAQRARSRGQAGARDRGSDLGSRSIPCVTSSNRSIRQDGIRARPRRAASRCAGHAGDAARRRSPIRAASSASASRARARWSRRRSSTPRRADVRRHGRRRRRLPSASQSSRQKIKTRHAASSRSSSSRNPDILRAQRAARGRRLVVGFAAETHDLVAKARRKLRAKGVRPHGRQRRHRRRRRLRRRHQRRDAHRPHGPHRAPAERCRRTTSPAHPRSRREAAPSAHAARDVDHEPAAPAAPRESQPRTRGVRRSSRRLRARGRPRRGSPRATPA